MFRHADHVGVSRSDVYRGVPGLGLPLPDEDPAWTSTRRGAIGALVVALTTGMVAGVLGASVWPLPGLVLGAGVASAMAGARMPTRRDDAVRAIEARAIVAALAIAAVGGFAIAATWWQMHIPRTLGGRFFGRDAADVAAAWEATTQVGLAGAVAVVGTTIAVTLPLVDAWPTIASDPFAPLRNRWTQASALVLASGLLLDAMLGAWAIGNYPALSSHRFARQMDAVAAIEDLPVAPPGADPIHDWSQIVVWHGGRLVAMDGYARELALMAAPASTPLSEVLAFDPELTEFRLITRRSDADALVGWTRTLGWEFVRVRIEGDRHARPVDRATSIGDIVAACGNRYCPVEITE